MSPRLTYDERKAVAHEMLDVLSGFDELHAVDLSEIAVNIFGHIMTEWCDANLHEAMSLILQY